ncbi:hypothetical protein FJTKL_12131 [Diaporthe vaccinii]|uniref:Uncharacterized protein n=1 Tax=Diaporthe vaccinii TaxID=105482 RepID=A0ABR4EF50_9PEZI
MVESPLYTASPKEGILVTEKKNLEFSTEKLREGKLSLFTRFLSVVTGLGVDVGGEGSGKNEELFNFARIETTTFTPSTSYIESVIDTPRVRQFLKTATRVCSASIYVLTGLKTVSGAKAKTLATRSRGLNLGVDVDGTLLGGSPVGGGPEISGKVEGKMQTSWEGSSDFVFAFRVRRVKVSKNGEVKSEGDYTKGANFGVAKGTVNETPLRFVVDDNDLGESEGWNTEQGWRSEEVVDEDEIVQCLWREHEDEDQ